MAKLLLGAQWLLGTELRAAAFPSSALLTTLENHLLARLRAWLTKFLRTPLSQSGTERMRIDAWKGEGE